MAKFKISKSHSLSREDVRSTVERLAEKLEKKHGVGARWVGDSVTVNGKGVRGELNFDDSTINISVTMGMLASAFESVLKKEIERYLEENLS